MLLSAMLTIIVSLARADWSFDAETSIFHDSNLSNSERSSDQEADFAWKSAVRAGNGFQLSRDLRLNLGADLHDSLWSEYGGFNEIGGGALASLRYRFGLGRRAPWILFEQRIGYDAFQETMRSGWDESLQLRGGVAISERIAIETGYTFRNFAARDAFFDLQGNRGDVRLVVDLTSSLQIAVGYSYRDGDIIAYAVPPQPALGLISPPRPVSTFGTDPTYNAYQLRAETHAVSISASYTLTRYLSVQLGYEYAATSHASLQYENHLLEAKIGFAY